jgi:hypothetical protein
VTRIALDFPAGLNSDDTAFAASPAWADCSNARFRLGKAQVKGGFESITQTLLSGVCRSVFPWTDNGGTLIIGFGTHTHLQIFRGGVVYDITPTLALPAQALGANPIATTNTTPTIVVTQAAHPYIVGDSIIISGASVVATVTINGTWTVTAITTNTWTFTAGSNANATTTGGGSSVVVAPQRAWAGGAIDGAGSSGYGTGAYGGGGYGSPSSADYFPLTWSQAAWGQTLLASPRNQTIFQWSNVTATPAVAVTNAPANVTYMLVAPQRQIFALGCNEEVSGTFNPLCIRHSDIAGPTGWSTIASSSSTSREYILPGGGRIVAGRVVGKNILVWTSDALWLGTYVGSVTQVWRFDKVGAKCGLIGPGAATVVESTAYWAGPDRDFHAYSLGGAVSSIECAIREDFNNNLAASQSDKIIASSVTEYGEIRFDYPDSRDGHENSRYISLCIEGTDAGAWHRGVMARTAMTDAGPTSYPCGVTYAGNVYWHEKGYSADGAAMAGFIESASIYLDENVVMRVRSCWPDISEQIGAFNLTVSGTFFPQGDAVSVGPFALAAGQDSVDFDLKARLFRIRLAWNSAPAKGRIGRFTFDAKAGGRK